jgi:hypothetical protein
MSKIRLIMVCFLLTFLMAACTGSKSPTTPTTAALNGQVSGSNSNPKVLSALTRATLSNYFATFEIKFNGPVKWDYQLKDRKSLALHEEDLHITGIDKAKNPGDVRSVTDGTTTWMIGPGTDNECVQFPNNQGMDTSYVFPETLISFQDLYGLLSYTGQENVAGRASAHYSGSSPSIGNWKDAHIDVWQDTTSGELLRFTMQASGDDSVFGTGTGKIDARYEVSTLNPVTISPVTGCKVDVPLPDSAKKLVRLPGLASFETTLGVNQMASFYQSRLPKQNWAQKDPPDLTNGSTILSYQSAAESVKIQIDPMATGGSKVKLLFQQGN